MEHKKRHISNVTKLYIRRISVLAVPAGGGFKEGLDFLCDPRRVSVDCHSSKEWVKQAIAAVRSAAGPNPWSAADDEAIAGEILRRIEAKGS